MRTGIVFDEISNRDWYPKLRIPGPVPESVQIMTVSERLFYTGTAIYTILRIAFRQKSSKSFSFSLATYFYSFSNTVTK